MSDFMRTLCKIAIPVTLQGMLQASFSIVNQIMIGQLGEAGIAAVGLCSNFTLIFSVMSGAVGTVAGILIAQFLGAEEHTEAWRSLDVSLVCGGVLAALFLLTAGGFPAQVLGLYTAPCGGGVLPHRGVLLSAHGGQHRPVRMAALQGTRRCPLLGKFWRGSGEHRAELSAHLRKAGCPRYGRYRCCHRHAGRAFYVYFPSTTESLISFSASLRSNAPPSATVTRSSYSVPAVSSVTVLLSSSVIDHSAGSTFASLPSAP